jgi:hypothetical protein
VVFEGSWVCLTVSPMQVVVTSNRSESTFMEHTLPLVEHVISSSSAPVSAARRLEVAAAWFAQRRPYTAADAR